jgi:hypothetical protein
MIRNDRRINPVLPSSLSVQADPLSWSALTN